MISHLQVGRGFNLWVGTGVNFLLSAGRSLLDLIGVQHPYKYWLHIERVMTSLTTCHCLRGCWHPIEWEHFGVRGYLPLPLRREINNNKIRLEKKIIILSLMNKSPRYSVCEIPPSSPALTSPRPWKTMYQKEFFTGVGVETLNFIILVLPSFFQVPVARNRNVTASLSTGLMHVRILVSFFWISGPTIAKIVLNESTSSQWYWQNISGSSVFSSWRRFV